jgi:hypothetical protein
LQQISSVLRNFCFDSALNGGINCSLGGNIHHYKPIDQQFAILQLHCVCKSFDKFCLRGEIRSISSLKQQIQLYYALLYVNLVALLEAGFFSYLQLL